MKNTQVFLIIALVVLVSYGLPRLIQNNPIAELGHTVDVVNDVPPVLADQWRLDFVEKMQNATTDQERIAVLQSESTPLTAQLISFLRRSGFDCQIDTVMYRYGSGGAREVASGDRLLYTGVYEDQPYAIIKGGDCFQDSLAVFILCFNGTFDLAPGSKIVDLGPGTTEFTIAPGEGLIHHVDFKTSIWLAREFDLPLYKGQKITPHNRITPDVAESFEDQTDYVQVTVDVKPGDHFNLRTMTYTPAANPF